MVLPYNSRMKKKKKKKRMTEKQVFISALVILLVTAVIFVLFIIHLIQEKHSATDGYTTSQISTNVNNTNDMKMILNTDKTLSKFTEICKVLDEYFEYLPKFREDLMYEMYDNEVLEMYGYTYDKDQFYDDVIQLYSNLGLKGNGSSINVTYKTYVDYTNYYLVELTMQGVVNNETTGEITYGEPHNTIYTVVPHKTEDGSVTYKILDFDVSDMDNLYTKFSSYDNSLQSGNVIPNSPGLSVEDDD